MAPTTTTTDESGAGSRELSSTQHHHHEHEHKDRDSTTLAPPRRSSLLADVESISSLGSVGSSSSTPTAVKLPSRHPNWRPSSPNARPSSPPPSRTTRRARGPLARFEPEQREPSPPRSLSGTAGEFEIVLVLVF